MTDVVDFQLEQQAEMLIQKLKHYLITTMGVTIEEANKEEFYRAFALTLREEFMINWTATAHTFKKNHVRTICYLCMEYLPGRFLGNNMTNVGGMKLIKYIMKKMNRNIDEELSFEQDPGLGNGGLGRLAACLLDSLATQQYPAIGYGLRYQYGIFDQEIWAGRQVERPDTWLLHENPWEFRRDDHAVSVLYSGSIVPATNKKGVDAPDLIDYEEVRALSYDIPIVGYNETPNFNVQTLRLWTTKESPRNFQLQRYNAGLLDQAAENTSLTDVLYPNDNNEMGKRIRLKQEFLLASASIKDLIEHHLKKYPDMSNFGDRIRIQINDTHPALVIAELTRILIKKHDFSWEDAWETVKACCSYTNHTVLRESLEEWNENRMNYLLPRQYKIIERLNLEFCNAVRKKFPNDEERVRRMSIIEDGQVRMAHLCIVGTHRVNGVAALHTEILKTVIFKDFYEMYPDKFVNVTNGVTQRRWLLHCNPELAEFLIKRIGKGWITDFNQIRKIADFAGDAETQKEFLEIKRANKRNLMKFVTDKTCIRDGKGHCVAKFTILDETALYDVQVKRFHEYKRQFMNAIHAIMIYQELKANPAARKIKRQIIFGGKSAPGYDMAKNIIQLISCISRKLNNDPATNQMLQVLFIENYNVSRAEIIIPAADLSEQISTAGQEASGTGNMKLSMNGSLTIGTEDGANIEMHTEVTDKWWPFSFGQSAEQNAKTHANGNYNPWDIYMHNTPIRQALDALRDRSFAVNDTEHQALSALYQSILEKQYSQYPDRYLVLNDLMSYYETQKKVEDLFEKPNLWAEYGIHNIAGMAKFSSDESVANYVKLVWDIQKCPVDPLEVNKVREEYSEHDKCRIFTKTS